MVSCLTVSLVVRRTLVVREPSPTQFARYRVRTRATIREASAARPWSYQFRPSSPSFRAQLISLRCFLSSFSSAGCAGAAGLRLHSFHRALATAASPPSTTTSGKAAAITRTALGSSVAYGSPSGVSQPCAHRENAAV